MSTNGVSTSEDVDMTENEGDKIVTMMDVLQEQQEFEEDANAVLGASDEKNCTFAKGYIKRQAIYACLTCCSEAKTDPTKRAGVCLACSLTCHENHDLVELYTKRNFCCDCGNAKFNSHPCQFTPNKTNLNNENSYNQNFSGVYCVCHRPYPDPESTVEDEMIQCIICEDWLHASHLEATVPPNDQYSEMICKACMEKNEFLHDYSDIAVNTDSVDVDVVTIKTSTENNVTVPNGKFNTEEHINDSETDQPQNSNEKSANDNIDAEMPQDKTEKCETLCNTDSVSNNMDVELPNQDVNGDSLNVNKPETKEVPIQTNSSTENQQTDVNADKIDTSQKSDSVLNSEQKELEPVEPDDKTDINSTESCDNSKKEDDTEPTQEKNIETENSAIDNEQEKPVADVITPESTTNEIENEKDIETQVTDSDQEKTNDNSTISDKILQSTTKIDENELNMDTEEKDQTNERVEADCSTNNLIQNPENTKTGETEHKSENESPYEEKQSDLETINKTEDNIENTYTPIVEDKTETTTSEITESTSDIEQNVAINQDMVTDNNDNSTKNDITDDTENKTNIANSASSDIENKISNSDETNAEEITNEHKRKLSIEAAEEISVKKPKLDETKKCTRPRGMKKIFKGATFWPSNFRQVLCTCYECISMYKDLSVLFLIDPEDTVTAYENLGKERINGGPASQYEKGLQALSSLDRVQQINALTEYNKMRDKLLDFLKSFKDRREIVKEEDIKAFFAGMKPKREPDGVYFCR